MSVPKPQPSKGSNTTKEARKAQTKADEKAGNIQPAGEGAMPQPAKGSETTKDARKAQTKSDVKNKKTQPAGE